MSGPGPVTPGPIDPGDEAMEAQRDEALRDLLDVVDPAPTRVLDLGCGRGEVPARLGLAAATVGVDVSILRLRLAPLAVAQADGARLPFPDDAFDLVTLLNVVSSVPDPSHRRAVTDEVRRVLAPGGAILWYDQAWPNPTNRSTRPVTRPALATLFPDATISVRSVTVVPALARAFPRRYRLLHKLPFLRSHLVGVIRPRVTPS